MAGMRISEVLNLSPNDVDGRKLFLRSPKSGRGGEMVYIPQKLSNRLQEYLQDRGISSNDRIFPISYPAARIMVENAGNVVGVHLRPHDLRRFSATFGGCCHSRFIV